MRRKYRELRDLQKYENFKARPNKTPIEPPYQKGLTELRHRLAVEQLEKNLAAFTRIHAASLHWTRPPEDQSGQDKQETPGSDIPEASTDHEPVREVPGGCSPKCA